MIIGIVLLCVASLTLLKTCQPAPCLNLDEGSNCPACANTGFPATIVLVDQTDPVTESQTRELRMLVRSLVDDLSEFEKISMYAIDTRSDDVPIPVFERCLPKNPRDGNPLVENVRQLHERFESDFLGPFYESLDSMITEGSRGTSPIIETIQSVVSNHGLDDRITDRHLIIISDLMQNVPGFSHYRDGFDYRDFKSTPYGSRSATNLVGVSVTIIYLWRPSMSPIEADKHLLFWENFIVDNGGSLRSVLKVK